MKKVLAFILVVVLLVITVYATMLLYYLPGYLLTDREVRPAENNSDTITIMSTNVRYISPTDFFEQSWFYRADLIADDIESVKPDIIGFQEVTPVHYAYLEGIMQGYDSENQYRDNFILSEGCPIFYRTDRFEKLDSGSFWLSKTPEIMSKDWGSSHYRVCVYVILRDRITDHEFVVFNTHLDNQSEEARINGIQVILDKIVEFGDVPAYLMGDLNATEDEATIQFTKDSFDDSMLISPVTEETATYHNWGNVDNMSRIDYILVSKGDAEVYEYHVINNLHGDAYSSDHSSIYIKTSIK